MTRDRAASATGPPPAPAPLTAFSRPRPGEQPPYLYEPYASTIKRAPRRPPLPLPHTLSETTGPSFARGWAGAPLTDLTRPGTGEALGQRIIVAGRLLDENGRPVPRSLVEIWQCNAAGRYLHDGDLHDAPIDPNFVGFGRMLTNDAGEYRFLTVKPGAYPWRNTHNAWRPAHIHFSLLGNAIATRLITQMYFPEDPLLATDPIFQSVSDESARNRMICDYEASLSQAEYALGYRFDIVLRGRTSTPMGQ
ncbi:MAG: protocatechuate 3,4-dioxygenase subunit beta [Myxococcales bacterium]